jgi:hypothetical protein
MAFSISGANISIGGRRIDPNHRFPGYRYNLDILRNRRSIKVNVIVSAETLIQRLLEEMAILRNYITERAQQIEHRRDTLGQPLEERFAEELEGIPRQLAFLDGYLAQTGGRRNLRRRSRSSCRSNKRNRSRRNL